MNEQRESVVQMQNLPRLIELLLLERGQEVDVPEGVKEQWDLFRALVNTRPPMQADDEFLQLQDELLQSLIENEGITHVSDIAASGSIVSDTAMSNVAASGIAASKSAVRDLETSDIAPIGCGDSEAGSSEIGDNVTDERLLLWRGDITTLAADAIVNAANSQMLGCFVPGHHCIDNAIHTFAGVQLRLECARLMEEQGYPEPTGMAKATAAFNLPSKYVIHTVGPIAEGEATPSDCALLSNCYTACLDAAADLGCESIAFCCISTGVFGFPQDKAAKIAISTVKKWLDSRDVDIKAIFNVFSERDYELYSTYLCE